MKKQSDLQVSANNWVRNLIIKDLAEKCSRNSRYSLRRYALKLGVSHTLLSLIINGKRDVSRRVANKVVEATSADRGQLRRYYPSSFVAKTKKSNIKIKESNHDDGFIHLTLDEYALISDWYYFAILSLLDIKTSKWDSQWLSNRLGISETQALSAMKLLEQFNFVEKRKNGKWKQSGRPIKVENSISTEFTRRAHQQILMKALESLEEHPLRIRDFSYCTFAMDEKLIPLALKEIRSFRRKLMKNLESKGKPSRVYNLAVQIFPITKEV